MKVKQGSKTESKDIDLQLIEEEERKRAEKIDRILFDITH